MKYDKTVIDHFVREEGLRLTRYLDTTNNWTIGIGHKLTPTDLKNNLQTITMNEAYEILFKDLDIAANNVKYLFVEYDSYPDSVQLALLDMVFTLGRTGLSKFVVTNELIRQRKFKEAAEQALKSLWARQVPNRARRVAKLLSV